MLSTLRVLVATVAGMVFAAAGAGELLAQRTPIRVRLPGNQQWIYIDSVATDPVSVSASPALAYKAAASVLQELKVPLAVDEPQNGLLGNGGFTVLHVLGRQRLSRYLSCGTSIGGAYADVRRITMALFVWIDSAGPAQASVKVGVLASAQEVGGVSRNALACESTGALEAFLADEIRKRAVMP